MLFSHSALILQLYLHVFQKLKYYTLENKDYSGKEFSVAAAIIGNAGEVKSTVNPLEQTLKQLSPCLQKPYQLQGFY